MGSPVKLHNYCHFCMSPSPHHHDHPHVEYSRCLEMRMNMDYSASRSSYDSSEGYPNSPFPGSPQSRASCMYSLHSNSPSIVHPLALRSSAERIMSPSKENGLYREIPPQCRRRLDFNHNDFMGLSKAVPVTVAKRNERERNRVKLINTTFQTLRQHLPVQSRGAKGQAKKLSKVQTLRSAIDYIRKLEDLIEDRKDKQSQSKEMISDIIKQEAFNENDVDIEIEVDESDHNGFDDLFSKETKQYSTINNNLPPINNNERTTSSIEPQYYRPNFSLSHSNNNDPKNNNNNNNMNNNNNIHPSEEQAYHRDEHLYHHPRAFYYQKSHYQDARSSFEGVGHKYNTNNPSSPRIIKRHSDEGSASPGDSEGSGDATGAEVDDIFDFDLWFWAGE